MAYSMWRAKSLHLFCNCLYTLKPKNSRRTKQMLKYWYQFCRLLCQQSCFRRALHVQYIKFILIVLLNNYCIRQYLSDVLFSCGNVRINFEEEKSDSLKPLKLRFITWVKENRFLGVFQGLTTSQSVVCQLITTSDENQEGELSIR